MTTTARLVSKIAIGTRWHGPNHPTVLDARRELRTHRAIAVLHDLIAEDPPLYHEQIQRIAAAVREEPNR